VLREAGVRRGRGPRGRPKFGWASLTPAERAVAGLVANGLTNPQIGARLYISRRTVHTHLSHVFAKLDIASSAQLAAQVTRRPDRKVHALTLDAQQRVAKWVAETSRPWNRSTAMAAPGSIGRTVDAKIVHMSAATPDR